MHDDSEIDHELPFMKLDVYRVAKQLSVLVNRADIRTANLRDQATRAANSTFLNLAEGLPSDSKPKRRFHFNIANGSVHEMIAAVDLAAAIGAMNQPEAELTISLGARVKRMLRALLR